MSPIPTNGVTSPPKKKPVAPIMADAHPMTSFPSDMASVVVEVKSMPTQKRVQNTNVSYPNIPPPAK